MKLSDANSYYNDHDFCFVTNIRQRLARTLAEQEIRHVDSASTLLAAESLFALNRWAKHQQDSIWRDEIYSMKSDFLHAMYAYGYLKPVELQQQIIKCNACHKGIYRRYYDNGDIAYEDSCYHCNGTGIYKRVLLYVFRVKIGDREFVWHQPQDRVGFVPEMSKEYNNYFLTEENIRALPVFKEPKITSPTNLSKWQFQSHLLRLAVYVTKFQMFEKLELCDWRSALKIDVGVMRYRLGNWVARTFGYRVRNLMERIGLVEEQLPF